MHEDLAWLQAGDHVGRHAAVGAADPEIVGPLDIGQALEIAWILRDPLGRPLDVALRSEEHTSELQSLMRISYAVFCLKKKTQKQRSQQNDKNIIKIKTQNITA